MFLTGDLPLVDKREVTMIYVIKGNNRGVYIPL